MWIYVWDSEIKGIYLWDTPVKEVYLWDTKIRPVWPDKDYLCFTAEQANSTVKLEKNWSPTTVTLETSTDWRTWTTYTIGNTITLSSIGDKVYWRNTSETATWFSTGTSNYYRFRIWWLVWASGDVNFLLCKNSTTTLVWDYCFYCLFQNQTKLTMPPQTPATTLTQNCYRGMFASCTWLLWITNMPALNYPDYCCYQMFSGCSKIKLSTTQTWDYQTPYRIPSEWTWSVWTSSFYLMFGSTWWTFKWGATINTTYYTSNTVV
jgi:hypothetical protein